MTTVDSPAGWHLARWSMDFTALATTHPTPFFLYNAQAIVERATMVKEKLGPLFRLYYAVKANPNPHILNLLRTKVDGVDVSSAGELTLALQAGYPPEKISFAGPGKGEVALAQAIAVGIGSISIESLNELAQVDTLARHAGKIASISVRINPLQAFKGFAIRMGGKASQFGIDEEQLTAFFAALATTTSCRLVGIHLFSGTQCLNADALLAHLTHTLEVAGELQKHFGFAPGIINLGGGFGIPYHEGQSPLDVTTVCSGYRHGLLSYNEDKKIPTVGVVELGRFLLAEAGIYVARIVDLKRSQGTTYCILDGGIHHHLPASGQFGQIVRKNFIMANLSAEESAPLETVHIAGRLCTTIDLLGHEVSLAAPKVGDLLGIYNSGAYVYSASPLLFLSHPTPAELLLEEGGQVRSIRASFEPFRLGLVE